MNEVASTDLIIKLPAVMTAETFTDDKEFEKLYSKVKEAVDKHVPDVSTQSGRDAIASLAYKVARTKTTLINQGKKLTESWRDQTKKVNAACNTIEERLDTLKEEVRKPLTAWETTEKARVEGHQSRLADLIAMSKVGFGRPSSEMRELLAKAESVSASKDVWEEFTAQAGVAREEAVDTLKRLLATAEKQEREAAELEQLRAEKAERDRIEAERLAAERAAQEAAERAERERLAEEKRQAELIAAAEEAARRVEREAQEKIEAANRAAAEAEERHTKAIREAEEARQREIEDAKRREAEAAERLTREIAEARAQAERDAVAERKRIADAEAAEVAAQKARDADREHRRAVNTSIAKELMDCAKITKAQAEKIVVHIHSGFVPNVTLKY
jgi:colicin import membrane protein